MRDIIRIDPAPAGHWVGDGFPVRSLLSHHMQGDAVSPFLLLDYAGPADPAGIDATRRRRASASRF